MVDTGSQVSTITEKFFQDLLQGNPTLVDVTRWMKVTGANDLDIPCIGYVEVDIEAFGKTLPNVGFLVMKNTEDPQGKMRRQQVPGVIGSNLLQLLRETTVDNSQTGTDEDKFKQILSLYETSASLRDLDHMGFVKVKGRSPVRIPSRSMRVIECTTKKNIGCGVAEAIKATNGSIPRSIAVVRTVVDAASGVVPVRVVNLGDDDVWLQPRTRIGTCSTADMMTEKGEEDYSCNVLVEEKEIRVRIERMDVQMETAEVPLMSFEELPFHVDIDESKFTPEQRTEVLRLFQKHQACFLPGRV